MKTSQIITLLILGAILVLQIYLACVRFVKDRKEDKALRNEDARRLKRAIALALIALVTAFALPSKAQTNAPNPGTFFTSAESYFTSFNTNLDTFTSTNYRGSVIIGADYVQSVNVSSSLGLSYDIGKGFSAESTTRNAGIAGVILSQQVGVGYNLVIHDVKITPILAAGYDFNAKEVYGAVGARVSKALTAHTFAGVGLEEHVNGHVSTPILSIFTGFTF